jgi:hypothetical protein
VRSELVLAATDEHVRAEDRLEQTEGCTPALNHAGDGSRGHLIVHPKPSLISPRESGLRRFSTHTDLREQHFHGSYRAEVG